MCSMTQGRTERETGREGGGGSRVRQMEREGERSEEKVGKRGEKEHE